MSLKEDGGMKLGDATVLGEKMIKENKTTPGAVKRYFIYLL